MREEGQRGGGGRGGGRGEWVVMVVVGRVPS